MYTVSIYGAAGEINLLTLTLGASEIPTAY